MGPVVMVADLLYMCLGCLAQKRARVTRNKTVRAVRPKADNIRQVGLGYYIWYQSRGRLVLMWGDCDILENPEK
jgi:hypothetical protein